MGANSLTRRIAKRIIGPLLDDNRYSYLQCAAMSWDILRGNWREPELDLIPYAVHEGDTVLDIGANFGLYSHFLGKAVGKSGKVYAFEPIPFTFTTLRRVAKVLRFQSVELVPKGCSNEAGRVSFRVPMITSTGRISAGQAYIGSRHDDHAGKETQVRWEETTEVPAELIVLDDYLPSLPDLHFIKADIEGAELLAFRGAERMIDKHLPTVLAEINPWFLEGFGLKLEDLAGFFFDKGYALYRYDDKARKLRKIGNLADVVEDNYIFLHPRRRDRLSPLLED